MSKCYYQANGRLLCLDLSKGQYVAQSIPDASQPPLDNRGYVVIKSQDTPTAGSIYPPKISEWYDSYRGLK